VHPADRVVVDPEMSRGDLADLDHALAKRLFAQELVTTEDTEREGESRHGDTFGATRPLPPAGLRSSRVHSNARLRSFFGRGWNRSATCLAIED
jgi:hypothetical protein